MIYTIGNTLAAGLIAKVAVNGNVVDKTFYADTEKGIVKYYPAPVRVNKRTGELYSRALRGKVTVELSEAHKWPVLQNQ